MKIQIALKKRIIMNTLIQSKMVYAREGRRSDLNSFAGVSSKMGK
jgi:hypothetical protein